MAWLYKQKASQYWWIGWRANGKAHFKSTGTPDKVEAQKHLEQVNALHSINRAGNLTLAVFESITGKSVPKKPLLAALNEWISECKGSTAPGTVSRYSKIKEAFTEYLKAGEASPLLHDITPAQIRGFLDSRRAARDASTVNLERKVLSIFFGRAVDNGILQTNPVAPVKALKQSHAEKHRKRSFTYEELQLIYQKAPDDFWRYMITAGFYLGQRMGDLVCLTWGAVDFDANRIRLITGKTGRKMELPLRPGFKSLLLQRRTKAGKAKSTDSIWPEQAALYQSQGAGPFSNDFYEKVLAPSGLVDKRSHKSKKDRKSTTREVTPLSFHSLRHSAVTFLKSTGSSQAVAKEIAGHSSGAISDHYTDLPIEALEKAVNLLPEISI